MDQSKSNSSSSSNQSSALPKRSFSAEFFVGIFTLACCAAGGWLAVGLGGVAIFATNSYDVLADFSNISGLKAGASVEIAGVQIGSVSSIALKDPDAQLTLTIHKEVPIYEDDIASIRTKGIIGDRYIKISRGGAGDILSAGDTLTETESVVDIEDIIGKIVHSMTGGKEDDKEKAEATDQESAPAETDATTSSILK